jgi:hypothetical protein
VRSVSALADTSTIWASPLAFKWVSGVECDIRVPSTYRMLIISG